VKRREFITLLSSASAPAARNKNARQGIFMVLAPEKNDRRGEYCPVVGSLRMGLASTILGQFLERDASC